MRTPSLSPVAALGGRFVYFLSLRCLELERAFTANAGGAIDRACSVLELALSSAPPSPRPRFPLSFGRTRHPSQLARPPRCATLRTHFTFDSIEILADCSNASGALWNHTHLELFATLVRAGSNARVAPPHPHLSPQKRPPPPRRRCVFLFLLALCSLFGARRGRSARVFSSPAFRRSRPPSLTPTPCLLHAHARA